MKEKPKKKQAAPKNEITITYGANSVDASAFAGKRLSKALKEYGQALNLPSGEKLITTVNGKRVMMGRILKEGDEVVVSKKKGGKL